MKDFSTLELPQPLMEALKRQKFSTPTPIQAETIPLAMEGKDILGSAETGTGKTAAFGIPILAKLMTEPRSIALIITPTRELATQVLDSLTRFFDRRKPISTALLIGGDSMTKQFRQLKSRPRLIVGTPGRINDHLERRSLNLSDTRYLVLDETDRMLDMGFSIQIDQIMEYVPKERQTLLFSATIPREIIKTAAKYQTNPVRISIGKSTNPAKNVKQEVMHVDDDKKYESLLKQLEQRSGSVIIFVKTRFSADKMANRLRKANHSADAIHGNLKHARRERVISAFRRRKHRIMVATDIAARGLDIPHIEHVINYDLPQCPEDYIHRIGRTARAGAEGEALCFVTPGDRGKWNAIHRLMNPGEPPAIPGKPKSRNNSSYKPGRKPFRFRGKSNNRPKKSGSPQRQPSA